LKFNTSIKILPPPTSCGTLNEDVTIISRLKGRHQVLIFFLVITWNILYLSQN